MLLALRHGACTGAGLLRRHRGANGGEASGGLPCDPTRRLVLLEPVFLAGRSGTPLCTRVAPSRSPNRGAVHYECRRASLAHEWFLSTPAQKPR